MDSLSKRNWEATNQALKEMQSKIHSLEQLVNSRQQTIVTLSSEVQQLKQQVILMSVNTGSGPTAK